MALYIADQTSQGLIVGLAMRQQQILVDSMEPYESLPRGPIFKKVLKTAITKHPFDEIFTQSWIAEPSFLFNRDQRELLDEGGGKDADPLPTRDAMPVVDSHTFDTAAG